MEINKDGSASKEEFLCLARFVLNIILDINVLVSFEIQFWERFPFDEIRKRIKGCKVIHFVGLSSKLLRAVTASSLEVEVEVN